MARIMTDSSSMLRIAEGLAQGIIVNPLSVTIGGNTYLDLEEMTSETFLKLIAEGGIPISSQPSIGTTLSHYHEYSDTELLNITMADGLSGTYQSAQGAVAAMDQGKQSHVHVVNSKTLWATQSYLVQKAVRLANEGLDVATILAQLRPSIDKNQSILIPHDFGYLKRGGRLSPFSANIGSLLKLVPVMKQSDDGCKIEKYGLCRNLKSAVESAAKIMTGFGVNENFLVCVSHAGAPDFAKLAVDILSVVFPKTEFQVYPLSPAMITQGGPGCIAIQSILK